MKVCPLLLAFAAVLGVDLRANAADAVLGAKIPWTTYEAEVAATNGSILGPDYTGQTPAREASSRCCVRLSQTGQFVEFTAKADANGLVLRYCIPDAADGHGMDATLNLSINGKSIQDLPLTSRYTYLYGDYPFSNDPAAGKPRHFWDEVRVMPGEIHRGDVIRLQKDGDNQAPWYLVDFIDLETVAAPLQKPSNAISIAQFGAVGNGHGDDRPALVAAIEAAKQKHQSVWIPPGRFVTRGGIELSGITLRGAGMWYSTLIGADDYTPGNRLTIEGNGSNITLSDFAVVGNLNYRNDSEANDGLGGSFGTGSIIRNIWVEHTKTGAWLINSDGLLVEGCRFRDTIADGINLCLGMRNTIVRNCSVRGNGDDCFAIWPATYHQAAYEQGHNRIINCTAQLPSLAQGFSIYGGDSNSVENCQAIDIPYGAGCLISTMFPTEFGFRGMTSFRHISMLRTGDRDGAIAVMTNLRDLAGVHFEDIEAIDSPTDGIKFTSVTGKAISDTTFNHIRIVNAGISGRGYGVITDLNAVGSATMTDVAVLHSRTGTWQDNAAAFRLIKDSGHSTTDSHVTSGAKLSIAQPAASSGP
jgi:Pectate lyase superfamily protein